MKRKQKHHVIKPVQNNKIFTAVKKEFIPNIGFKHDDLSDPKESVEITCKSKAQRFSH